MTRARASRAKLELHESGTFNAKQVDADMPRFLPTINPTQFNYPIDIRGKWHGNRYRFVQRYRSGQPETLGEEFDAPFTRLDWMSRDRFDLQWHRHTGTWFCLHRGLSLVEALKTIEADGLLHPHSKSAF